MHKSNRCFKLELEWAVFSYKLPSQSKKVIQKRKFHEIRKVARRTKSCSKSEKLIDGHTELVRSVDVVMARAKRIYILIIKVNKLFSFFLNAVFSKRNKKHVLRVSIEFTNSRESLGELEKAVETLACGSCFHNIYRSPKLPLVFL